MGSRKKPKDKITTKLTCFSCNLSVNESISCNKCLRIFHSDCIELKEYKFDDKVYTACPDCLDCMQRMTAANPISVSTPSTPSRIFSASRPSLLIDKAKFDELHKFMSNIDVKLKQISTVQL